MVRVTTWLIVLHVLGCLFFGGTGIFTYWMLGKVERYIPADKTQAEREELIRQAEAARGKLLPWVALACVLWEINVIVNLFRRIGKAFG